MKNKFEDPIQNPENMEWNEKVKLIISDVDETIADLYTEATPEMIAELEKFSRKTKCFF